MIDGYWMPIYLDCTKLMFINHYYTHDALVVHSLIIYCVLSMTNRVQNLKKKFNFDIKCQNVNKLFV